MATSMGTKSCFGMGLAVGATKGGAGIMDVITGSSNGDRHCDVPLFDDNVAVATSSTWALKTSGFAQSVLMG